MDLNYRPAEIADLPYVVPLLRNGLAFPSSDVPALLAFWRHLLLSDMAESTVIEDRERPPGQRIVGFGLSVFVTNEFAQAAKKTLPPCIARQIFCRWQEGKADVLTAAQIRRLNTAKDLNVLILHNGWLPEEQHAVRSKVMEAFFSCHIGYGLKQVLHEAYSDTEREKMLGLGWHLETDYAGFSMPFANEEYRPFLMSLRREDALGNEFHHFYRLFNVPASQLGFRPAEQALLRRALLGASDAEAAKALSISLFTVHKRWRAIFAQVTAHNPTLLPEASEGARGAEKRSRLLRYLQSHPEELRPSLSQTLGDKG